MRSRGVCYRCVVAAIVAAGWAGVAPIEAATILIDFGSSGNTTASGGTSWNNIHSGNDNNVAHALQTSTGAASGAQLTVTNPAGVTDAVGFSGSNSNGATAVTGAAAAHGYPSSATGDSLFGSMQPYETTSGTFQVQAVRLILTGLDDDMLYSFDFFASRAGLTGGNIDNRETQYTVTGAGAASFVYLNATNNTSNIATITGISPDANNQIIIDITAGPNNTNQYGFFYLNTLEINSIPAPIPEAGSLSLLSLGMLLIARRRRG